MSEHRSPGLFPVQDLPHPLRQGREAARPCRPRAELARHLAVAPTLRDDPAHRGKAKARTLSASSKNCFDLLQRKATNSCPVDF